MTPKRKELLTQIDSASAAIVKYKGHGAFIPGVPARDMTPVEWESLPQALRDQAIQADLYMAVEAASEPVEQKDGG